MVGDKEIEPQKSIAKDTPAESKLDSLPVHGGEARPQEEVMHGSGNTVANPREAMLVAQSNPSSDADYEMRPRGRELPLEF